jgi:phage host-nuclease inhibitor protein Gam
MFTYYDSTYTSLRSYAEKKSETRYNNEMAQENIDYTEALAAIKAGLQNVVPRVVQEGNRVKLTQGSETFTFNIVTSVTNTTIMK